MNKTWNEYHCTVRIKLPAQSTWDYVDEVIKPAREWTRTNIGDDFMEMYVRDSDSSVHFLIGFKTVEQQMAFKLAWAPDVPA